METNQVCKVLHILLLNEMDSLWHMHLQQIAEFDDYSRAFRNSTPTNSTSPSV